MRAFDELPEPIKEALRYAPFHVSPVLVRDTLRASSVPEMLHLLRLTAEFYVKSASKKWQEAYGSPSPHVAARATLMMTRRLPEARVGSYEHDRWEYFSPARRAAVNRLRQARGQETIPPPKVDRYVPPPSSAIVPVNPNDPDIIREIRAHGAALGLQVGRGDEGFTVKSGPVDSAPPSRGGPDSRDEGFSIR